MAILTKKTQEIRGIDDGSFSKEMAVLCIEIFQKKLKFSYEI